MKRIVLISILLGLGAPFTYSQDSIISIPDPAFLNALIYKGVDTNGDSLISYPEAEAVDFLSFNWMFCRHEITSLIGIEAFINLEELHIHSGNHCGNLVTLDLSDHARLKYLECTYGNLNTLNIAGCDSLVTLACSENQLTSLDVSGCAALKRIDCRNNQLTSLDVSGCIALRELYCSHNQLTSLDLCHNDSLRTFDLQNMPTLNTVYVSAYVHENPLEDLYVNTTGSPNNEFINCADIVLVDYIKDEFYIYPNPANDILIIETNIPWQHYTEITSLNGQVLYTDRMKGHSHQINLSSLQKGLYIITIRSRDYVRTEKIIKQ